MIKKLFLLILIMSMIASVNAAEIDGIKYNLITKAKRAEVTGVSDNFTGALDIPNTVVYNGITYDVMVIMDKAFVDCTSMTSVTIPNSVKYVGSDAFQGCTGLVTATIGNSVTYLGSAVFEKCSSLTTVTIGNSITHIDLFAFSECRNLTTVNIPNSVTTIDDFAFEECSSLTSIVIPNSVTYIGNYVFFNCSGLTSVDIGSSVETIGDYAFRGCTSLTSVSIPNSVKTFGGSVFYECSSLESTTIPSSVTQIGANPFQGTLWYNNLPDGLIYKDDVFLGYKGDKPKNELIIKVGTRLIAGNALNGSGVSRVTIPNSVISIGKMAFYGCGLTEVTIPNSVLTIGDNAFYFCRSLKSVSLGNSVRSIGLSAFASCPALASINLPNSLEYIGEMAFNGSNLTSITIPNSVKVIGDRAFINCHNLQSFNIPSSVNSIGENPFKSTAWYNKQPNGLLYIDNVLLGYKVDMPTNELIIDEGTRLIANNAFRSSGITTVTIPNTVTYIGEDAFRDCRLSSVSIPNSVTSLEEGVFSHCDLQSVTIPNSVTLIGEDAFYGCKSLTSVTIPNSVISVGDYAFTGCIALKEVYSLIENPFPITYLAFRLNQSSFSNATLYVPIGDKEKYRATDGWMYFPNILQIGEVTLKAKSYSREYGNENPVLEYEVTEGALESGAPTLTCSATNTSPVGTYDIVIEKGSVTNSIVNYINGTLTITKAPLTISAGNYTKEVGEETPTFIPSFSGFKNNETNSVLIRQPTFTCEATTNSPAGTYPVKVSGAEAQNYNISYINGTLTIKDKLSDLIIFADINVKNICVKNWDTNGDGELSKQEASVVKDIGTAFANDKNIRFFNELMFFTGLENIRNSAFSGCNNLSSVIIPNSTISIGKSAFRGCYGLKSIVIPNSITSIAESAFAYCKGLISLVIGSGLLSLGYESFIGTDIKKTIWLTNTPPSGYYNAVGSVNYVANDQYSNLDNKIVYPFISSLFEVNGIYYVPVSPSERLCDAIDCAYNESVVNASIPSSVTYQGISLEVQKVQPYICYKNEYIETITCENTTDIAQYAFSECLNMTNAMCNNNGMIGDYVFSDCTELKNVTIGEKVTSIGNSAFRNCSALHSVNSPSSNSMLGYLYLSKSVNSVGDNAFYGCKELKNLIIKDRDTELSLGSNGNLPLFSSCLLDSVYIGGDIIYKTTSNYGYSPFYQNTSLRTIVITDRETEISENEFYGCTNLQSISIGDGVTKFGNWAFSGCSSLKSLSFGSQLRAIGQEAFSDCTAVTKINSKAQIPPTCGVQALDDINKWNCTLYVPKGSLTSYKAADQWKEFFFMEEEQESSGVNHISADDVQIIAENGEILLSGIDEGSYVFVYSVSGQMVGSTKASSNQASLATTIKKGEVAIIIIGEKSVKMVMQ